MPGGQNQYSPNQEPRPALLKAQQFIDENLANSLTVTQLADLAYQELLVHNLRLMPIGSGWVTPLWGNSL